MFWAFLPFFFSAFSLNHNFSTSNTLHLKAYRWPTSLQTQRQLTGLGYRTLAFQRWGWHWTISKLSRRSYTAIWRHSRNGGGLVRHIRPCPYVEAYTMPKNNTLPFPPSLLSSSFSFSPFLSFLLYFTFPPHLSLPPLLSFPSVPSPPSFLSFSSLEHCIIDKRHSLIHSFIYSFILPYILCNIHNVE